MLLVIETATPACSIALLEGPRVVRESHAILGRGHAERLIPMIAELVEDIRPDAILVDCGPGSFTGVRVGLAAAHGLAIGWKVPLAGFSSTALIAAGAEDAADEIGVALQGGHGELFVQSYQREPLAARDGLQSLPPERASAVLSAHYVLGSGAETLVRARGYGLWADALPRAADAARLSAGLRNLPASPIYGRAPDAKPMP